MWKNLSGLPEALAWTQSETWMNGTLTLWNRPHHSTWGPGNTRARVALRHLAGRFCFVLRARNKCSWFSKCSTHQFPCFGLFAFLHFFVCPVDVEKLIKSPLLSTQSVCSSESSRTEAEEKHQYKLALKLCFCGVTKLFFTLTPFSTVPLTLKLRAKFAFLIICTQSSDLLLLLFL